MFESAVLVGSFLLTALGFLIVGFVMGRKTNFAPVVKEKIEKAKESQPFVDDINEDPYAIALEEDKTRPKVVGSL